MTNNEAIRTLKANYPDACFEQLREAVDVAIKALTAQADSKELSFTHKALDTVSRQAVIEAINKIFPADPMRDDYTQGITCGAALATEYIKQLPSAQPDIIRCKDCKHFAGEGMYCSCDIIVQFDHFYCYHAERRQDV